MYEQNDSFLYKLRFLIVAVLVVGNLLLISVLLSSLDGTGAATASTVPSQDAARSTNSRTVSAYDNPNVVAGGLSEMASEFGEAAGSAGYVAADVLRSASTAAAAGGRLAWQGGVFVAFKAQASLLASVRGTINTTILIVRVPINTFGFISKVSVVRAAIQPADHTPVPIIGSYPSALAMGIAAVPAQVIEQSPAHSAETIWPIHGQITTLFGVPHWPWQPTHTGLDISSGQRSGVTPVKPFRPGRVVETVRSYGGLGNYVVVDHGNGLTSVYAHLYSISAQVGQPVDRATTLGTEGSTGASTGTHLHFEVRLNGHPVDPRQYVSGHP